MKKLLYYISLIVVFIVCLFAISCLRVGIEMIFNVKLGGYLVEGLFLSVVLGAVALVKPVVKKLFHIETQAEDGIEENND